MHFISDQGLENHIVNQTFQKQFYKKLGSIFMLIMNRLIAKADGSLKATLSENTKDLVKSQEKKTQFSSKTKLMS